MQHKKPVLLVPTELVHKRTFAQHADRALILAKRALSGNLCYDPSFATVQTMLCPAASDRTIYYITCNNVNYLFSRSFSVPIKEVIGTANGAFRAVPVEWVVERPGVDAPRSAGEAVFRCF